MRAAHRPLLFLAITMLLLGVAMTLAVNSGRSTAAGAADRIAAVNGLQSAMFDEDAAARGFLLTADERQVGPYVSAQARYATVRESADRLLSGNATERDLLRRAEAAHTAWRASLDLRIAQVRARGVRSVDIAGGKRRKADIDAFRASIARLDTSLDARRDSDLARSGRVSTVLVVLLVLILGAIGYLLIRRSITTREAAMAAEMHYRVTQRNFTDVLQGVATEGEAHRVLKRHIERSLPGARATVLARNNSDNRLEATTPTPEGSTLQLSHAEPRDCVAIRLGRPHADGERRAPLLPCVICGGTPGNSDCRPLLVSGQVIGSVLVEHAEELDTGEDRRLTESVSQAAPVLANLRTIAIAESRAATDSLTGLANRRAVNDTLNRMVAHASRSVQPLAAIAIDLDHFKQVNDRYGHDVGDSVLASVAELLKASIRESDFVGRLGGEEFIVLCPDTNRAGALVLAEKLRGGLASLDLAIVDDPITASFGIAVMPDDAATAELLLKRSDRALYLAKDRGRNRVESTPAEPISPPSA